MHHLTADFARSLPQLGPLTTLVVIPLQALSGAFTPREGMLEFVRHIMLGLPDTHFVMLTRTAPFCGAGIEAAWPQVAARALTGSVLFVVSPVRLRRTPGSTA